VYALTKDKKQWSC